MTEIHKPTIPQNDLDATTDFGGGFVKLHRSILTKTIWKNQNLFRVFSFILLSVKWAEDTYTDGKIKILLKPGEMVGTLDYIATHTGLTRYQVRQHTRTLQKSHTIDTRVTQGLTVISLVNFSSYHARKNNSDTELTQEWHKSDTRMTLSKELKKKRNKELNRGERVPLDLPPHLGEIWSSYSQSHEKSYGVPTLPPHKSQLKYLTSLHAILGEHAPKVVAYYCSLGTKFYVSKRHALKFCVEDADKLYTAYMQECR